MPAQNANKKPAANRPSTASTVKAAWKRSGLTMSLKTWVRERYTEETSSNSELATAIANWRFNKKVSTSKPALGVGRTNRISKGKK